MKSVPLNAYPRTLARRAGAKKLREQGRVPAVMYGGRTTPRNLELIRKEIEDLIHHSVSENLLVDLTVTGDDAGKRLALLQEVQHHTLSGKILHVDLHEVSETERVTIMVPVDSEGEAAGVKSGGVLEHVLFKLRVRALPKDLPEVLLLDVSHLEIGQAIHIGDIKPPPGVEILGDKHISVIAVAAPITEAEEAAAEAASSTTGEVEMIKEKKEEGEEGAGEKKPEAGAKGEKPGDKKAEGAAAKGATDKKAEAAPAKAAPAKGAEKKK